MAQNISYFADDALAVSSTAVSFVSTDYGEATDAIFVVEDNPIRYYLTGTTPTASLGILAVVGSVIKLDSPDQIKSFLAIATGADAVLSVMFGR